MSMVLSKETNIYKDTAVTNALNQTVSNLFYDQTTFNRLTHDGTIQGIFLDNGQLYINMNFLRTGTLELGGVSNQNGTLVVKDASGNTTGTWDMSGIKLYSGTIGGWTITETVLRRMTPVTAGTASTQYNVDLYAPSNASGTTYAIYTRQRSYNGSAYGDWVNNFYVRYDGTVYCTKGQIANWLISSNMLSKSSPVTSGTATTQYEVSMQSPTTVTGSAYAIQARQRSYDGSTYGSWANNFYVRYDGYVYAKNLNVAGGSITGANITLGGSNNASGVIHVNNASGTQIGSWDYTGLTASGSLTMTYGGSSAQYKTFTAAFSVLRYLGSSVVQDTLYGLKSSLSQNGTEKSYYCICPNVSILDVYTYTQAYNMEILYGTSSSGWHFDHHVDGSYFSMVRKNNSSTKTYKEFDFWIYGSTTTTADFRFYDGTFKVENGSITYNSKTVQFVGSSSVRYKNSITDKIDKKLDAHALYSLTMKQFVYNDDFDHLQYDDMKGKTLPGFIAEDVDKIYPAAVIHDDDGNIESWDERRIIPPMLALIQEQKKKIDELEETVNKFKQVIHVA